MTKIKGRGQTDQDIIRAIGYITDDKYIAAYFGVETKRVNQLRREVEGRKTKMAQAIYVSQKSAPTGMNSDSERKWNANAKVGSAQLLAALNKFFEKRLLEKAALERGQ
jgi:hypothetical protein